MTKHILEPMEVVQTNEKPFWSHPVFMNHLESLIGDNERIEDEEWRMLESAINCDIAVTSFEDSASDELIDLYFQEGDCSALCKWTPVPPNNDESWFVVSIHDTEDGAVVWWAKQRFNLPQSVVDSLGEAT